jgi:hypothetical protein
MASACVGRYAVLLLEVQQAVIFGRGGSFDLPCCSQLGQLI